MGAVFALKVAGATMAAAKDDSRHDFDGLRNGHELEHMNEGAD